MATVDVNSDASSAATTNKLVSYLLSRDSEEKQRLNEQHVLNSHMCGFVIHPALLETLAPNARIADVGAGSAAWGLEVATKFPAGHVDAIDISSDQFPSTNELPGNVALHVLDMRGELDSNFVGKFDLIHVRSLVAGLSEEDWSLVAANLLRMLKQGGSLQWIEADLKELKVLRASEAGHNEFLSARKLVETFDNALKARGLSGPRRLATVLKESGYSDVKVDIVSSDRVPETRQAVSLNYLRAIMGWATAVKPPDIQPDAIQKLYEGAQEDISAGAYLRADVYTVRACKG